MADCQLLGERRSRWIASSCHILGLVVGFLPGLLVWFVFDEKDKALAGHGRSSAQFQFIMFVLYVSVGSLFWSSGGRISPQRSMAFFSASLAVGTGVVIGLANLSVSFRSAWKTLKDGEHAYPDL